MKVWIIKMANIQYFPLVMLLGLVFLTYSNRVDDLDLWWHLKSGEVVIKDLSLPKHDIFAYTTGMALPLTDSDLQGLKNFRKPSDFKHWEVSLSHSWLGQIFLYLAWAGGGFYGIGMLKAFVFVFTFLVMYWAMRQKGAGPMASLLVIFLASVIGQDFAYSRPQIFTFLSLALLVYIFADFKNNGRKCLVLPLLFLAWSNLHGGFVIGAVLLLAFWVAEAGKYLLHARFTIFDSFVSSADAIRKLSFSSLLSIVAMFLNPNHYKMFLLPLSVKNSLFASIEEYARPMLYEYHAFWFMLALVLLLLILLVRRNDPTDILLVGLLVVLSQAGIRGIFLFVVGAAPFLAVSLSRLWQWVSHLGRVEVFFSRAAIKNIASYYPQQILFLVLLLFFSINQAKAEGFMQFAVNAENYPGGAVAFLQAKDYPGRLFNPYNWGGYLIWTYPQRQVFIDGRCLDEKVFFQYLLIAGAHGGLTTYTPADQDPLWKRLLDDYEVQVILTNAVNSEGGVVPLVNALAYDPDWALVYQDGTTLVFLRDSPGNRSRYGGDHLNKISRIYDEIVSECQKGLAKRPATWGYYNLLGLVYLQRRELDKAREMFETYLRMNPNDVMIVQNLNLIRQLNGEPALPLPRQPVSPHPW